LTCSKDEGLKFFSAKKHEKICCLNKTKLFQYNNSYLVADHQKLERFAASPYPQMPPSPLSAFG